MHHSFEPPTQPHPGMAGTFTQGECEASEVPGNQGKNTEWSPHPEDGGRRLKQLEVVCSLPSPDDFEPSENQAMNKWKCVFTPPPRETQADEYEVIIPAFPQPCLEAGVSNDWCITHKHAYPAVNV